VRAAAEAGAGAVKFQTFRTEYYVSRTADAARFQRLKGFELTFEQFAELARLARSLDVLFGSTPLDLGSAKFLESHVDFFKIASADNDFYPLLDVVASTGKPMIVSTGVSDLAQVEKSVRHVRTRWKERQHDGALAVLHCVSCYPAPPEQASLGSIHAIRDAVGGIVGYSDHTMGIDAAVTAVALGARIVEKHFTLNKQHSAFRDHQLSADPTDMRELVRRTALVPLLIGRTEKRMQPCEAENAPLIRRSLAAAARIPAGQPLRFEDLMWIRPAGGVSPGNESVFLGKRLRRAVEFGDVLDPSDVE
jgi:N,N'-diacetyllegionaminate synthase